jgi:hypothetical protein
MVCLPQLEEDQHSKNLNLDLTQYIYFACEMLNYSHSRTARVRPHGRMDKSKRPECHPTNECARARVRCLKTEPNYYYCPITLVMSWLTALV